MAGPTGEKLTVDAVPDPHRSHDAIGVATRVACHVAVIAIFTWALVDDVRHHWRATGDDAIIAQRSWSVLSLHGPLVGQFSQGSGGIGHIYYDPGPLLFWLLALPVRLDHVHGVLWGSALACVAGAVLAVEAARAFRGAAGGVVVVVAFAVIACTQSFVIVNPVWNPSIGVVWFIATLACAAAVASGRFRWWPALVLAASVAAQAHLEFTAVSVALVVLALVWGLVRRTGPVRAGWLASGLAIGVVCWLAPALQEVTGRPGNLTVAWSWLSRQPTMGSRFGLQSLASVTTLHPLWLNRQNRGASADTFLVLLAHINGQRPAIGVVVVVSLVAITVGAWLAGRRDLATLAVLASVAAVLGAWTMSSLPAPSVLTIVYADVVLWPIGMVIWVVWIWTAAALVSAAVATAPAQAVPSVVGGTLRTGAGWLTVVGILVVGGIGAGVAASTVADPHLGVLGGWEAVGLVPKAVAVVDRTAPRGPVALYVEGADSDADYSLAYGVIWQLDIDGRQATATAPHWQPLGPGAAPSAGERRIALRIVGSDPVVTPK